MRTVSIKVTGRVQGVFFRQSTKEKALALSITGEVRNLPNGDVYIIATGDPSALEELATWCKNGPARANVYGVAVTEHPLQACNHFKIIHS